MIAVLNAHSIYEIFEAYVFSFFKKHFKSRSLLQQSSEYSMDPQWCSEGLHRSASVVLLGSDMEALVIRTSSSTPDLMEDLPDWVQSESNENSCRCITFTDQDGDRYFTIRIPQTAPRLIICGGASAAGKD